MNIGFRGKMSVICFKNFSSPSQIHIHILYQIRQKIISNWVMGEFHILSSLLLCILDFVHNNGVGGQRERERKREWAMGHPSVHSRQGLWIKDTDSENYVLRKRIRIFLLKLKLGEQIHLRVFPSTTMETRSNNIHVFHNASYLHCSPPKYIIHLIFCVSGSWRTRTLG